MNTFEKALENIAKEYPVRRMSQTYAQIDFLDLLFDAYNCMYIGILYEGDEVILTDYANYAEICEWEDEDIKDIEKICHKHGITFINYHIECLYQSNEDVKHYLDCLLELKEIYAKD